MKKIGLILGALVALLTVSCNDMLLQKDTNGISVSFMAPGGSNRAGATNNWNVNGWLELEDGTRLQQKEMTVPASAPISLTFTEVAIGTKLRVRVDLVDSENSLIKHTGSSNLIEVNAQNVNVTLTLEEVIVGAANPTITSQPESQTKAYEAGNEVNWTVTLTVEATSPDGGNLSYQWHESSTNSNTGGNLIPEATKTDYQVSLAPGETKYFYCVVTNTNDAVNGTKTATTPTNVAKIVYDRGVYGQVSGVLLWTYDTSTASNNYKIVPYKAYSDAGVSLGEGSSSLVWCFDNTGNLYWYAEGQNGAQRFDLQSDESYISSGIYYSSPPFSALSYDNSTNILYGIGDGGSLKYWQRDGGESVNISDSAGLISISEPLGFAVYNNIVYVASYSEFQENDSDPILGVVQLSSYKLEDASDGGSKTATLILTDKTFTLPESFGSNPPVSQMIYQDGALYLLLGRVEVQSTVPSEGDSERFSCGALVKIEPSTLAVDTSFGDNGYLGLVSERLEAGTYSDTSYSMTLYSPTASNESEFFYGPVGFVAVMPKKLVIGDAGYALSNKDEGGLLASRKNRVVTVDLETQAFAVTSLSDVSSYGNTISGSGFLVVETP